MSLEAALDEERRDVLALLEGRTPRSSGGPRARAASPGGVTQSPVRSMLDIVDAPKPNVGRHASIAGQGVGITALQPNGGMSQGYRSMLGPGSPPSGSTSPPPLNPVRSHSPAINQPRVNLEKEYNFEILPTNEHGSLPKRVGQGGKKSNQGIFGSYDNTRSEAVKNLMGKSANKSKSPVPNIFGRTASPATKAKKLNSNSSGLMAGPNAFISENGQLIDMASAYRRLSDAALLRSGGSLSSLPIRKGSDPTRGEALAPDGGVRLTEDYPGDEDAVESSDDSSHTSDEEWGRKRRGRGRRRTGEERDLEDISTDGRRPKSLLGAAEEERKNLVANRRITSLLDPMVPNVDAVDGKPAGSKRSGIHPRTSYDTGTPSFQTPHGSDDEEELDNIKRAQSLSMNVSPINSDAANHRCIRQIVRGNYLEMAQEAAQGLRRQRMYLVATDMSEEAAYALEWTIGTVLKDGDTLFAIYAADAAEVGEADLSQTKSGGGESGAVDIGQGAAAMKDTAGLVRILSNTEDFVTLPNDASRGHHTKPLNASSGDLAPRSDSPSARSMSRAPMTVQKLRRADFSGMKKAETDRWKATERITERCIALLRQTKLQVRVVIDCFHCKSPRHMITEVVSTFSFFLLHDYMLGFYFITCLSKNLRGHS
ncbi:hypothetical protein BT63DRAFT_23538 [Microthyrium microscopicum]|uniref:UspA domain-containing protein n=1 Tax=Microthyrium microscopicum TaxID=703497 RepID=A0A6A6UVB2_9PEZI|nr:hypothetical protein BT63DRAFT_23538 [Microthyrium microscopicum]